MEINLLSKWEVDGNPASCPKERAIQPSVQKGERGKQKTKKTLNTESILYTVQDSVLINSTHWNSFRIAFWFFLKKKPIKILNRSSCLLISSSPVWQGETDHRPMYYHPFPHLSELLTSTSQVFSRERRFVVFLALLYRKGRHFLCIWPEKGTKFRKKSRGGRTDAQAISWTTLLQRGRWGHLCYFRTSGNSAGQWVSPCPPAF